MPPDGQCRRVRRLCSLSTAQTLTLFQVRHDTNFSQVLDANPWLKSTKLVVKPDMLFGKRGKHDLVGLNLDYAGVEAFIRCPCRGTSPLALTTTKLLAPV
jgi:succinyl-CoA synthetase beta subunit